MYSYKVIWVIIQGQLVQKSTQWPIPPLAHSPTSYSKMSSFIRFILFVYFFHLYLIDAFNGI